VVEPKRRRITRWCHEKTQPEMRGGEQKKRGNRVWTLSGPNKKAGPSTHAAAGSEKKKRKGATKTQKKKNTW